MMEEMMMDREQICVDTRETLAGEEIAAYPAFSTPLLAGLLQTASQLIATGHCQDSSAMEHIVKALPTIQAGLLWLYERRSSKLQVASLYGLPLRQKTLEELQSCQLNPGETLVGLAFQRNELLMLAGFSPVSQTAGNISERHKTLFQDISEQIGEPVITACIPLHTAQETIGVLHLFDFPPAPDETATPQHTADSTPRLLTAPMPSLHCDALKAFASLLASGIKSTRLAQENQRQSHRLNAFDAVVTAISNATDLQTLMSNVLEVMMEMLPFSSGAIFLLDPAQAQLKLGAHMHLPQDFVAAHQRFAVEGAAFEEVVHYGQPITRPLLEDRGEEPLLTAGLESCVYLPLLVGGTVVGVLGFYGGATLPKEIEMYRLMPLCHQIGFAIANVRLYEDSQLERRKLNTLINSIAEGVVLCDSKGRLVLANEAAMDLLSLESLPFQQPLSAMVDFYGMRDLEAEEPLPIEQLPMARALSGEIFHDYRVLLRGDQRNSSVMSFSGAPTLSEDGTSIEGAVVIFRDITANQRLERAKDEFLAVAAHELRSPLASVRAYSDLLLKREQKRQEADPRDIRGLTILSQQVNHLLRMVDNLLDVSRLDAGQLGLQLQRINLVTLIGQVLDQNRPAAALRELVLETEHEEIMVACDSMRVRQVVTNLVGNAIKYSPAETRVTVSLSIEEHATLWTQEGEQKQPVPQQESVCEVLVRVADQGTLIPPEQQERLFTRYYRAGGRRAEGLGLGLYLSQQFVLMHGGRIWLESVEGIGNTFCFTLPLQQ